MTGFERLLYTDCPPGGGRGGGPGFQIQAQSEGVTAEQARATVRWLLFEAQPEWIGPDCDVDSVPKGFAHTDASGWGTAQSRYLGTVHDGRRGNHVADCLLTLHAQAYGPIRPAQLWLSEVWRERPWPTTVCPPFNDPLPVGPLTTDAVAEWVRADVRRSATLAKLLSVLEAPTGPRVHMPATSPADALRWIAAATLLLPAEQALGVSFKVFSANLMQSGHRIVAVPKELNPRLRPGTSDAAFVLDADTGECDDTVVSARAAFWVESFVAAEDAYDCVDAVELAETLTDPAGRGAADARITAWAITDSSAPLPDPDAPARWLLAAKPAQQSEHGPGIVDRILAHDVSADHLDAIDALVSADAVDYDKSAVRSTVLARDLDTIRTGGHPPAAVLPRIVLDDDDRRDAESALSNALLLGSNNDVDAVLVTSRRHGIELAPAPHADRLRAFAAAWADSPHTRYDPDRWALRDEILDLVRDELRYRVSNTELYASAMPALDAWWPFLLARDGHHEDAADLLGCELLVARYRSTPAGQRAEALALLMDIVGRSPQPGVAFGNLQWSLQNHRVVDTAVAAALVGRMPTDVPVAAGILQAAVTEFVRLDAGWAGAPANLRRALQFRTADITDPRARGVLMTHTNVDDLMHAVQTDSRADVLQRCVWALRGADPHALWRRFVDLLDAAVAGPSTRIGIDLLLALPEPLAAELVDQWYRALSGPASVMGAARGFVWSCSAQLPGALRQKVMARLTGYAERLSPKERKAWAGSVHAVLPETHRQPWADVFISEPKLRAPIPGLRKHRNSHG